MQIRTAGKDDLARLSYLGALMYEETKLPGKFIPECFVSSWEKILDSGNGILIVAENAGEIVGGLGGLVYQDVNDGELTATEMFWYVHPEFRGAGLALFKQFEARAIACGAKRLLMVHLHTSMAESLSSFYGRNGYRPVETHYVKEA